MKPPAEFRLPGPHYVLENAIVQRPPGPDDRDREKQRNMSAADLWFRSKKRSREEETPAALMTPPMNRGPPDEAAATIALPVNGAPEIPIWLAEARGCDPLPDTPPQDSAPDAQAWGAGSSTQSGVGLGLGNAYLFDGSWSSSHAEFDAFLGGSLYGNHPGQTALLYERARGSASTAIPPAMHGFDRPAGAQLPYPRQQQQLNDFVS